MSWFEEQIQARKKADNEIFEDSFLRIAGSVMGKNLSLALSDERVKTKDAVDEILKYYHIKSRDIPENVQGINAVLEFLLRPSGIMFREVELTEGFRNDACGAMLTTFADDNSPVSLIPSNYIGYTYTDPVSGTKKKVDRKTEKLFSKTAYVFYKPFPMKKLKVQSILAYMWQNIEKKDLTMYIIFSMIVALIGILLPRISHILFSDVVNSQSMRMLIAITIFLICTSISAQLFGTVKSLFLDKISVKIKQFVQAATMMRVFSLPPSFFKKYSAGDLSNRTEYVENLVDQILNIGLSGVITSLLSLIYIGQIFKYTEALVKPAFTVTFVTLVISVVAALMQVRISREAMELDAKESGMGYALVSGIQKIKLSGAEKRAFSKWARIYAEKAAYLYNPPMFLKVHQVLTQAVTLAGTIVMYYLTAMSDENIADYYAFTTAYAMVSGAFLSLSSIAVSVAEIRPILDMIEPIMETVPEASEEKEIVSRLSGSIELNNITFRYQEDMPPVLDDLSLRVKSGQYVAIVGKTGCGKSTLMRIMLGFETPQRGAVYYDGKDLKRLDVKSLRSKIGSVMQNGKLFQGDIYSNIVISDPGLSLKEAWEAAELAGMSEDIESMPMGMFTIISEGQGGISGGQRQRLMIARAIAPKPKILMFDEATSALDNITQKKVSESLNSLKCTRIVIAHRLSTIRECDRIIVLEKGKIIEDGTYEELIKNNGFFADLVRRQQIDTESA